MQYNKVVIGCLKGNKTNEFYKHMGADFKFQRDWTLPNGQVLKENVYVLKIN